MIELLYKIHFAHIMNSVMASCLEDELLYGESTITSTEYNQIHSSLTTICMDR